MTTFRLKLWDERRRELVRFPWDSSVRGEDVNVNRRSCLERLGQRT